MNSLQFKFDYTKYKPEVLMKLFNTFRTGSTYENRFAVLMTLIFKYIETKKSFNIYSFFMKNKESFWNKKELIEVLSKAMNAEFSSNLELPKEYREDFFLVLIMFLDNVDRLVRESDDVEVSWELYNIPKLMEYLSSAHTLKIDDITLRAKINNLVENIKTSFKKVEMKTNPNKEIVPIVNLVSVDKLESFKHMKLQKSGLTQGKLEEAMKNFDLLNDKDKIYLLDFMIKKNWTYAIKHSKPVVFFDFLMIQLKEINPEKQYIYYSVFKPFRLLLHSVTHDLTNWFEYFEVQDLKSLFQRVKEFYFSFEGATEIGWNGFIRDIVIRGVGSYKNIDAENEFVKEYRTILLSECVEEITETINQKGITFGELLEQKEYNEPIVCEKSPDILESGGLKEYIKSGKVKCTTLVRYWNIYDKYRDVLFEYTGTYITSQHADDIHFQDEVCNVQQNLIREFIQFLPSIYFDGFSLQKEIEKRGIDYNRFSVTGGDFEGVIRYIRFYFCYNYNDNEKYLSLDFIKSFCYSEEVSEIFRRFAPIGSYTGAFNSETEYDSYFYKRLENSLDFAKKEDMIVFFRLKTGVRYNKKLYESFLNKLQEENKDCYDLIYNFIGEKVWEESNNLFNVLETYYEL